MRLKELLVAIVLLGAFLAGCMHEDGAGGNETDDGDSMDDGGGFNNTTGTSPTDTNTTAGPSPTNNTTGGGDEEFVADVLLEVTMRDLGTGGYSMDPAQITANQDDNVSLFVKAHQNNLQSHQFAMEGYDVQSEPLSAGQSVYFNFTADQTGEFAYYGSGNARTFGMEGTFTVT